MKTVKLPLFLLCLLISVNSAISQNVIPGSEILLDKLRLNKVMHGIEYETYETVAGDPFLFGDFHEGEIIFKNGEAFNLNLRYDIYADQVHLKDNDQIYGIIHPETLASIRIDTVKFLYCNFVNSPSDKSPEESSYFIVKKDGKCKLLIKKNIRVQDAELPRALQDARPAKFVHLADTYYLKQEGKYAVRINSKKDITAILADKKNDIDKFIRTEKLKTKEVDDLAKIVTFYDSL